jgi:hypothetical protein
MPVYFIFLCRKHKDVLADVSFRTYFGNDLTWQHVISASNYKDASRQWTETRRQNPNFATLVLYAKNHSKFYNFFYRAINP